MSDHRAWLRDLDDREDRGETVDPREQHDEQLEQADRHAEVRVFPQRRRAYCRRCGHRWNPTGTMRCPNCSSLRTIPPTAA